MELVSLRQTLTFNFARVYLYCSMGPLMYDMTTLVPSMIFSVNGFGFLLGFDLLSELCWVVVVLWDFVKVILFFYKKFRCRAYLFSSVDEGMDNKIFSSSPSKRYNRKTVFPHIKLSLSPKGI